MKRRSQQRGKNSKESSLTHKHLPSQIKRRIVGFLSLFLYAFDSQTRPYIVLVCNSLISFLVYQFLKMQLFTSCMRIATMYYFIRSLFHKIITSCIPRNLFFFNFFKLQFIITNNLLFYLILFVSTFGWFRSSKKIVIVFEKLN